MIRLTSTEKLQAVLGGAVSSTQPQAIVCYSDKTSSGYAGGKQLTALNNTTDVDILSAPAASTVRDVDYLSIFNRDSASVTVTVKYDVSATDSIIITVTLSTLESLIYTHAHGWHCLTSDGKIKVQSGSSLSGSSGDVLYTSASSTFSSESSFNYDSTNNILAVDNIRLGADGELRFDEHASAPGTPAAGNISVYAKADGRPYGKDDAGTEFEMYASIRPADGRITLSTSTPVMTSDVSNSTSIYYTSYIGNHISLYDGTNWVLYEFSELTNTTTDNTKNPAAVANNSNYDLFVWNDSGTLRLGRGPAWTSDTARGTGAGTTELERVDGVWLNKIAITNGPAAQLGRYVGTIRSDGSATIDWELGGSAAGGDPGFLYVWNMYNRVHIEVTVKDSTDSWTNSTATWVSANSSNSNRVSFVIGIADDGVFGIYTVVSDAAAGKATTIGVGVDTTTAASGAKGYFGNAAISVGSSGWYSGNPGIGLHYIQAVEKVLGASALTFYGDGGGDDLQMGLSVSGMF